jgi:esterase/lipase superfamily enzyme
MHREYQSWFSPALGRDMEILVFGHSGARMIVFPTRNGRFFDYENWRLVEAIRAKIEGGYIQLFCVDSLDSEALYADWAEPRGRIQRYLDYQRYIIEEVLPFSRKRNPQPFMIAHGCSFGAFHAINVSFRYPHFFGKVVAFSGRYDVTSQVDDFRDLLDGYIDEDVYLNNPAHYLPNLEEPTYLEHLRRMEIVITIGAEDPFRENNEWFSAQLAEKGIPHQLHLWEGRAHRARYWREMLQHYV